MPSLPSLPDLARRRPPVPRESDFSSWLRSPAVSARVGVWLGICFGVAFLTGVISHYAQAHTWWVDFPTRPVWGYRVTQGLHVGQRHSRDPVAAGQAVVRLPQALRSHSVDGDESCSCMGSSDWSIGVLVAAAIFQLATGLLNTAQWYPWAFSFRASHYAVAWVAIGALVVHIAVKLPVIQVALSHDVDDASQDRESTRPHDGGLTRRGLLRTTWTASALAVLLLGGEHCALPSQGVLFGVRSGDGPEGIPINKSAKAADVIASALDPGFRLVVAHGAREVSLSREQLSEMAQHTRRLPIACVEGWSAQGSGPACGCGTCLISSGLPAARTRGGLTCSRAGVPGTVLQGAFADDEATLLALRLDGEDLEVDHGYPCRLIAPNRPGVLQTKWVDRIEVMT